MNSEELYIEIKDKIPIKVQKRILAYSKGRQETGEALISVLQEEAQALMLYDAIYAEIDAEHDLPNPKLSRSIRGCIDHRGRVPDGADRDNLLLKCPQILEAIECAYQKHVRPQPPTP